MYQFIKPFLDNKMSIFEEYGAFKVSFKIVADDILKYFFFYSSQKEIHVTESK